MKKGFTLVELLAVIVVLALILAIAVPTIANLIATSKKNMFENSSKMILKSMKNDYDGKIASTGSFTDTFILYDNGVRTVYPSSNNLDFAISATDGGIVRHSDGSVTFALYDGTNCSVKTRNSNDLTVSVTDKSTCLSNIIYKQASAPFNNMLANGNFSSGTASWVTEFTTLSAQNNTLIVTATGGQGYGVAGQSITNGAIINHKLYTSLRQRITNSEATLIGVMIADTSNKTTGVISFPVINQWYNNSGIVTLTATSHLGYKPYHQYSSTTIAAGKIMELQEAKLIDLTAVYGTGNEPTVSQMDHNINKVWIDTANGNTPKKFTAGGWVNY